MGDSVPLPAIPQRAIALAPSLAEIAAEVGVEARLAGVADLSDYPPSIARLPRVGGYYHLNLEAILAANPDLVILLDNPGPRREAPRLRELGIPVAILRAEKTDDIALSMRRIGEMLGAETAGVQAQARFLRRYGAIREVVADERRPRVYFAMGEEGLMTAGALSYIHDLVTDAGGENIAGDVAQGYPRFSLETIIARAPEAILFSGDPDSGPFLAAKRRYWARWPMISAVRDGRLLVVDHEAVNRPGPRVVEALAEIAAALHPRKRAEIERALRDE